jgi:hypothetical protein
MCSRVLEGRPVHGHSSSTMFWFGILTSRIILSRGHMHTVSFALSGEVPMGTTKFSPWCRNAYSCQVQTTRVSGYCFVCRDQQIRVTNEHFRRQRGRPISSRTSGSCIFFCRHKLPDNRMSVFHRNIVCCDPQQSLEQCTDLR